MPRPAEFLRYTLAVCLNGARPMTRSSEILFLLSCARTRMSDADVGNARSCLADNMDWTWLQAAAARNRLGPLLYRNLRETRLGALAPQEAMESLKAAYHGNLSRTIRLDQAVKEVVEGLKRENVPALVLRGPAVGEIVYGDNALRPYTDIDLLVPKPDAPRAKSALRGLGYAPLPSALDDRYYERHHLHLQYRNPHGVDVELHWSLDHPYTVFNIAYDELFREAVPGALLGTETRLLSPEHLLLTVCVHLVKHAYCAAYILDRPDFASLALSAGWLLHYADVAEAIRHCGNSLDWDRMLRTSRKWNTDSVLQPALASAVRLFQSAVPESVLKSLPASRCGWIEKRIYRAVAGQFVQPPGPGSGWRKLMGFKRGLVFRPVRALDLLRYLWPDAAFLEGRYGGPARRCRHLAAAVGGLAWNAWDLAWFSLKRKMEARPETTGRPPRRRRKPGGGLRIVFLGQADHANTCNSIARAINRCDGPMRARAITLEPHPFEYEEDIVLQRDGAEEAGEILREADWIISSGDGIYEVFNGLLTQFRVNRRRVHLATRHAGSAYRSHVDQYNDWDRRRWNFERRFMACDLYRFVLDDPRARVYLKPPSRIAGEIAPSDGPVRVSHSPSDRGKKGTDSILRAVESCRRNSEFEFDLIEDVPHQECRERRNRSHIFIDQNSPEIGGFGASALEAMAAGVVVLCNWSRVAPEVGRWIELPPILMITSEADIERTLMELLADRSLLEQRRRKSLAWAQKNLTPKAVYNHWWRCLTSDR